MAVLNTLLEITIYSGIIFAATMLLKKCFKNKLSPRLHYLVWLVLILRLMLPVTLNSPIHFFSVPAAAQNETASQQTVTPSPDGIPGTEAANNPGFQIPGLYSQGYPAAGAIPSLPVQQSPTFPVVPVMFAVWLAGAVLFLSYFTILYFTLRLKIRRNAQPPSKKLLSLFEEVKSELGIKATIKIVCTYEYGVPALLFPKTVTMPVETLVSMDDEQIRFALCHELTHFRRGDQIMNILLSVLNAIYWFNPFIWLAFRQIRSDMEVACDSMVVKKLAPAQRNRYASLIVSLFARPAPRKIALGMAQGDTKKAAEKRVRGIYMNGKSRISGKLVSILLAAVLFVACFTTSCQPNPDHEIVVGKGNSNENAQQAAATPYQATQHWKEDTPITLNGLTVTIDADVSMPSAEKYPVIRVKDKVFTQEEADKIIAVLSQGKQLYSATQTKEDLEQDLIAYKAELERYNKENAGEQLISLTELMIKDIEEQIKALPEKEVIEPPSTTFQKTGVGAGAIFVRADLGKAQKALIAIENKTAEWPNSSRLEFYNGPNYWPYNMEKHEVLPENSTPKGIQTTQEQATAQAQSMIEKLGIQNMQLAVVRPAYLSSFDNNHQTEDVQCWQLTYARQLQGIPVSIYKEDDAFIMPVAIGYGAYNSGFTCETLTVQVDDTGIVLFLWAGSMELLDTINENAKLLPFADIQQRIKEQLPIKFTNPKARNATFVQVTNVQLGLARVRIKDAKDDYMLIPVWDVYGYNDATSPYISGKAKTNPQDLIETLLTVNAMDGSVIDRSLGY